MKTKAKEKNKTARTITFQPNEKARNVLASWDETGYDRTILMNNLLVKFGEKAAKELPPLLEEAGIVPRMVRGGGFEPPTPTVSR